jgi:hypothetical protein
MRINMNIKASTKALATALILSSIGYAEGIFAHSAGGVIDAAGNNPSATDLAQVSCYDDGDGPTGFLFIQIQDLSAPVQGLLMSIQALKDSQMINDSDLVSGDGNPSPGAQLWGGNGVYYISVSKTAAGARTFNVTYHCMTSAGVHTGTDITLLQAQ